MIRITIPKDSFDCAIQDTSELQEYGGLYKFYDAQGTLLYIGKTGNVRSRIRSHCQLKGHTRDVAQHFAYVSGFYEIDDVLRDIYETWMINRLWPPLNVDKVYSYRTSRFDAEYQSPEALQKEQEMHRKVDAFYRSFNL